MRISVINEPAEGSRTIILKEWHLEICDHNQAAAILLSHLIYWHEIRLENRIKAIYSNDVAEKHGDRRTQDESLYQFHTERDLERSLMIFGVRTIREGVRFLESKGFISIHKNPNPRYAFDKTKFFLVHPEKINEKLMERYPNGSINSQRTYGKSAVRLGESAVQYGKTAPAITKNTTKNTREEYTHSPSSLSWEGREEGEGLTSNPSPDPHPEDEVAITGGREMRDSRKESFKQKEDKEEGSRSREAGRFEEKTDDEGDWIGGEELAEGSRMDSRGSVNGKTKAISKKLILEQSEEVYDLYPVKTGKKAALVKIANAIKEYGFEELKAKVKLYAEIMEKVPEPRFIPYPATWFNQGRYEDDPDVWRQRAKPVSYSRDPRPALTGADHKKGFWKR